MYSYLKFRSKAEVRGPGTHQNRFVLYIFEADIFLTSGGKIIAVSPDIKFGGHGRQ
jgi:hypothetical protein